ncbi:MAG: tetratricopeptide repeat protein [Chloroflexi bacterium]|nr:tetratricopeptide repeat protein [Chloroflexota bacterium]
MPRSKRSLSELPLLEDTWLISTSHLWTWVKEGESPPRRPYLILIASSNTGLVCGSNLIPEDPTAVQVADVLFQAMRHPPRELGKACRPRSIALADTALLEPLRVLLKDAELEIEVFVARFPDEFDEIIRQLEAHLRANEPEIPAMLATPKLTVDLLRGVFEAAAEFYRAAPWVRLSNNQVIAVRHPNEHNYHYALVMGQGGVEYGLVMYADWSEVQSQSMHDDDPLLGWQGRTWNSLTYDTADLLPFADLDAIEEHNFEIASEQAYPVGVVLEGQGQVRRPTREEWEWYEAALRVIPVVVREHLHSDSHGDHEPIEADISVKTRNGMIKVGVKYPAGELPLEDQPAERLDWGEREAGSDEMPAFDRRSMEGVMPGLVSELGAQSDARDPALARAQQVMYRAWEEVNPAKRIALAHEALSLSRQCADAYVLLAEEEADTVKRALELYKRGIEAGASALGAEYFRENAGYFWGLLETRPYMRARQGLAQTLWRLKRYEEAIEHYRELLHLNPGDNQGNRYALLNLLIQIERYEEARTLLKQYQDEWSAEWLYSRALLEFQKRGASAAAKRVLQQAIEENPFVPAYLIGQKRVPNRQIDYYGWGDESEAVYYVSEHLNYWRRISGAVEWLQAEIATRPQRKKPGRGSRSRRTRKRRTD